MLATSSFVSERSLTLTQEPRDASPCVIAFIVLHHVHYQGGDSHNAGRYTADGRGVHDRRAVERGGGQVSEGKLSKLMSAIRLKPSNPALEADSSVQCQARKRRDYSRIVPHFSFFLLPSHHHRAPSPLPPPSTATITFIIMFTSLFLTFVTLFVSTTFVRASPCVTFDANWNLLAFSLDGKDWNAGTQDSWANGTSRSYPFFFLSSGRPT